MSRRRPPKPGGPADGPGSSGDDDQEQDEDPDGGRRREQWTGPGRHGRGDAGALPATTLARPGGGVAADADPASEVPLTVVATDPRPQIDPSSAEALIARAVVESVPFQAQVARAGRGALSVDLAYSLLARLLVDGGRTPSRRLMAGADLPERSVEPNLAVLRRLLNLDGCTVVSLDVDGVTVRLDRAALVEQFGIRGG